jgi:hypothetical protein
MLKNVFYFVSYYPALKRHSYGDEEIVEIKSIGEVKPRLKRRSFGLSLSALTFKMHQHTTTETVIGVPSPLCSVCGDISTGK